MSSEILHIIQGGKGGTLEYLKNFLKFIDKSKYNCTIICHGEIYEELTELGYNTCNIEIERSISPIKDLISFIKINKYIKNNKVDLIHAHSSKAGALSRIAAKFNKILCVYNPHGWAFNIKTSNFKRKFYEIIEKILSNWCARIVMISESEYESAVKKKICDKERLVVINNGIDINKYDANIDYEFRRQLGFNDNEVVIGMCCRITEQKSPSTFIKIAKMLVEKYDNCKFIIIGDGELRKNIVDEIKFLNLEKKIFITGWIRNPEKYVNIIDIGVLTSKWEGFGLVLTEYMACGKPIVASSIQGIRNVVRDGIDGFLCNPDDENEFVEFISMLINNKELYNEINKNEILRVKQCFDFQRVVREHEFLYDQLIKFSNKYMR